MKEEKKSQAKQLQDKLTYTRKNYYEEATEAERAEIYAYGEGYKTFLDNAKTEREACDYVVAQAKKKGFSEYALGDKLKAGDKKYYINRGKSVVLFRVGTRNLEQDGLRIIASHIDAPRVDIKQNPLYEDGGMCFLKTHYYGGIKKYQWTAIPLALHGVVVLRDGKKVNICVGEKESDPVFYINDLLPHLGADQMGKTAGRVIEGEQLNVLVGGLPYADKDINNRIKLTVLQILNEQ